MVVVLGARGRTTETEGISEEGLSATALHMVQTATCPVMIVRPPPPKGR